MPKEQRDAIWHMFSTDPDQIKFGLEKYTWKRNDYKKPVIKKLIQKYESEGLKMSYTEEDFFRAVALSTLSEYTIEERLRGIKVEDLLKFIKPEDRLKGIRPEDRLKGIKPEDRLKGIRPKDRLKGIRPEMILKYIKPEDRFSDMTEKQIKTLIRRIESKKKNTG
ncbi:hypothetical protein MHK_009804 [Candidatus Magnetomorum sp. HK-1]|nr:hypothetical protein MHK_009804 [Candidatus Magnetomorum sp. HK-1]